MNYEGTTATLERASDLEKNPAGVVKRWLLELKLADKRESDWRKKSEAVWKRYRQKDAKRNSFNILWSNTETLRPAVYNSLPKPDVRRRFKDADPLGKAVSEVLSRSLEYGLDVTDFDSHIKACVLDMLLPGRGVARVRYVPSFAQVGVTEETHFEENEQHEEGGEALEGDAEELEWEQTPIEHVQWDDFRISAGKEWGEVCWIAFRHRLCRDELVEQFGEEIGNAVQLDNTDDDDVKAEQDQSVKDAFKTAEVWEIWDKDETQVLFIAKGYKESPLKTLADPLNLQGFWPIPRPLYATEDSSSLVPVTLYDLYKEQADELDQVTRRINIIIKGLKLRGIYDATLSELSELMRGEDNDLIPAQNATALLERGGLEKAVLWMPIDMAALVLKELYIQREQTKQVIYEITGISDILRGSTNANETATAQQIKNQWGSQRLKRMQAEVARFIRDLMRLQAEIIAEKFQPETLATMTGLQYSPEEWVQVISVLRDDKQRTFKVDVETDSTVAASVETDMDALQKLMGGIVQLVQGLGPAVQMGAMPVEAVKEMILAVTRRAKLGNAVEDALDKIQQPQPQQQPEDNSAQVEQAKQQAENQRLAQTQQHEMTLRSAEMQHEQQMEGMRLAHDSQKFQEESALRQAELAIKQAELRLKEAELALKDKEINTNAALSQQQMEQAEKEPAEEE